MSYFRYYRSQGFASINFVTVDNSGNPVSPDADPTVSFYRVDPSNGTLAQDLNVSSPDGFLTMAQVDGFLYSASLDLSETLFENYSLVVTYTYGGLANTHVANLQLHVSNLDQAHYVSTAVTSGAPGTTYRFPSPPVP